MNNDLTGMQLGFWFIKRQGSDRHHWIAQCSCGSSEREIYGYNLTSGKSKSCGCAKSRLTKEKFAKRFNLVNRRFGRLWVLWGAGSQPRKDGKGSRTLWECKCDCGKIVTVKAEHLRNGHTKSCGCLSTENRLGLPGEAGFNALFAKYQAVAKKRGLNWELTEDQFRTLASQPCYYCGQAPSQISVRQSANGQFAYNGIDRLNNLLGYVSGNVVSCCGPHNRMKGVMSYDEFVANCLNIVKYRNALTESVTRT